MDDKGKYYRIIVDIMNGRIIENRIIGGVSCLYKIQIKGIYETIPHYFEEQHAVDIEEFKFSMRWVLADMFFGGCEVNEPEDLFEEIS